MKPSVIIALVVVGGVVIVAPVIAEYLLKSSYQENVARILEKGAQTVTLQKVEMGTWRSAGCWISGTLMAAAGVVLAFRLSNRSVSQSN